MLLILRLIIAGYTGLGTGESYYFRGAYDVALSYLDQPPLFFWISHLSLKIFGMNTLALRLPDVLFFSGTSWVLFLISRHFFTEKAAFYTVLIFNLSALYIIDGIWFQPDAPLLFFWALSLLVLVKLFFPKQTLSSSHSFYLWMLLGISMGLTGLSKYHVIFFFLGMLMFILTRQRSWFKHPGFYISFILCGIFFIPILLWNYQNDWASIRFQSSRAINAPDFTLHFEWFFRSFLGQAFWLLPWIWVPIVYELVRSYKLGRLEGKYWFFFCMALFPIVFFTLSTLWADLSYHFHWQSVGYMILFVPLGATIERWMNTSEKAARSIRYWITFSAIFAYGLLVIAALQVETGFWQTNGPKNINAIGNPHIPKSEIIDPTMDSYDYDDLLTYFESKGLFNQSNTFVAADNWLLAGKVDWALKGKLPVYSFGEQRNYIYYFNNKQYLGQNIIYVSREKYTQALSDTRDYCNDLQKLDDVPIVRNGRVETHLTIYTCKNFHLKAVK